MEQRVEDHLASEPGDALQELFGAHDDHFALLDPALADRRLFGETLPHGLDRVRLGRLVGLIGLGVERSEQSLGVGNEVRSAG